MAVGDADVEKSASFLWYCVLHAKLQHITMGPDFRPSFHLTVSPEKKPNSA
jgi:hypothetical protein